MVALHCPFCDSLNTEAEWVDIGVGSVQAAPYQCGDCEAQEMDPYHDNSHATAEEKWVGWWKGPQEAYPIHGPSGQLHLKVTPPR